MTTNPRYQPSRFGLPPRLLLTLYGLALLLALPATWTLFTTLGTEAHGSLAPMQLLEGFNYTVFSDFWQQSSKAVMPVVRVGWLTAPLYWLVWCWVTGGILYSFKAPIRTDTFWQAGTHFVARYARLLGLTGVFTLAVFLVPLLIGILLAVLFEDALTERGLFWLGFGGFAVGALGTLLVWCIADYARVWLFRTNGPSVLRAFGQAGRLVLKHPRATFGPYLLLTALTLGLLGLYLLLDTLLPMRSWALIGLMIGVQQGVVLGRLVLKVLTLRVAYRVSERYAGYVTDGDATGAPLASG